MRNNEPFAVSAPEILESVLQVADVILAEGNQRFSTAVKYLTQSTWSHASIYVGHAKNLSNLPDDTPAVIEADLENGVIAVPLSKYMGFNTRICRPIGLNQRECRKVVQFMLDSLGMNYDLKNVIDLVRYLIPTPPVPNRWRRSMLALGSGEPTRVICRPVLRSHFNVSLIRFSHELSNLLKRSVSNAANPCAKYCTYGITVSSHHATSTCHLISK